MSRKCQKKKHLFLNWLKANHSRFTLSPRVIRHYKNRVELNFIGITNAIRVLFYPATGIMVNVFWKGIDWDFIEDFDVAVVKSKAGYGCALCEELQVYPTRNALWIKHGFEPFLDWSNSELATAKWLELYESKCGTSAKLHQEKPSVGKEESKQIIGLYLT